MATIDLSQLTAPDVIETLDFETLLAERKAALVALYPTAQQATVAATLELESEPLARLLQENCYREIILRARYNDEARSVMLAYATGTDLDQLGVSYYQEVRLLISAADTRAIPPVAAIYETDDNYRARLASKIESYSTAGPTDAYIWFAKSADARVLDAYCDSPTPGTTRVVILSTEGDGTPSQALVDIVAAALNRETIRPLCEEVQVVAAQVIPYAIDITLYILPGPDSAVVVSEAHTQLAAYAASRHRLDDDVTPSGLYAAAHRSGVQRAVINTPPNGIVCSGLQAAYCTGISVTSAGVDQ
jgi:phage-related baseplate assembly protein